ncbi:UbiX family flavin prenyltransferase [Pelagibacterium flavum]|uniref:UbiX family flavin prenyltransferase n=1 Tax=Pelagibacterium flavum TaxID=2984530 RepID=A0ABY6IPL3_9HYPH|nr:UbiX family flavin prenyltransferase [Pelagibacterium sp. YIM 151497]UYQ71175.1 UbiX family flavin prenyltransferase [Pelagibacterium sp. YIM 151497]
MSQCDFARKLLRPIRVVVGVSGASGSALAHAVVERLHSEGNVEIHLVVSRAAEINFAHELGANGLAETVAMADHIYEIHDIGAAIASGSFDTDGMLVVPCSIRTLSAIANCFNDNLLVRAADVHLKERRTLILAVRETPLHLGHIELMRTATLSGAVIFPPSPPFYLARTMNEAIDQLACRMIDGLRLPVAKLARGWEGLSA